MVQELANTLFGNYALQLGVSQNTNMLEPFQIQKKLVLASSLPFIDSSNLLFADSTYLPLTDNSCDLVIIHHLHELVEDPHSCIREAGRVVLHEGSLIIFATNPSLLWLIAARFGRTWQSQRISSQRLKDWLRLIDYTNFEIHYTLFPSLEKRYPRLASCINWFVGFIPVGSNYCIKATKRTPSMLIRPKRKKILFSSLFPDVVRPTIKTKT